MMNRRHVLKAAGALLALPLLESLKPAWGAEPANQDDGRPPLRQFIITVAGGTVVESWKPEKDGPLQKLPSILRPLDAHKSELLVLSGLSQLGKQTGGGNAHTHCAGLHLTGAKEFVWEGKVPKSTISIDQAAAAAVAGETILPSLELGQPNGEQTYSWSAGGTTVPYEGDPKQVFDRLFKGRAPSVPTWSRDKKAAKTATTAAKTKPPAVSDERLVIDLVLEDAKALQKRLGKADQTRIGEFLEAVHSLETRIVKLDQRSANEAADRSSGGGKGSDLVLPKDDKGWKLRWNDQDPEARAEYIELMTTLGILALQTDTTRVVTMSFGTDGELWDGVVTVTNEFHHHTLEHQANADPISKADPLSREACRQIHEWYSVQFAKVLTKMRAIDEAGSSLLDNSMVLYTSYMANGGHGTKDYPVLLAGRGKGTLRPGRHLALPMDTPVANLYLEMLDRMGDRRESFGGSTGRLGNLT
jgi:Protein of unknown function (DUF1552)